MNAYLDRYREAASGDFVDSFRKRSDLVAEYAWAIPTEEAIAAIVKLGPIVEMGAGTGYWASLIAAAGGVITCYDAAPPGVLNNTYRHAKQYYPVAVGGPVTLGKYPDSALMLCWPPYSKTMAFHCLKEWSGRDLIYIGEDRYGCNANEDFFDKLEREFDLVKSISIPQWDCVHDCLYIYRRK